MSFSSSHFSSSSAGSLDPGPMVTIMTLVSKQSTPKFGWTMDPNIFDSLLPLVPKLVTTTTLPQSPLASLPSPLLEKRVLTQIFSYLDVTTLKNCRPVCRQWSTLSTPPLLSKGVIVVDTNDRLQLENLTKWMTLAPKPFFKNIRFDTITHTSYPQTHKILGDHVKTLTVSHWWNNIHDLTLQDYEDILLNQCPLLEELELPCTKKFQIFKDSQHFLQSPKNDYHYHDDDLMSEGPFLNLHTLKVTGEIHPHKNFWRIIEKSPYLKRLHLSCPISAGFWDPFKPTMRDLRVRMENVEELETRSYANESITRTASLRSMQMAWNLKKVAYECYTLSDAMINRCAKHLKNSMENFHLILFNKKYGPWPTDKGKDWFCSSELSHVTHFHLELDDHCEGPIFCRAMVLSVLLPNLKNLKFTMFDGGQNGTEWGEGLFNTIFEQEVATTSSSEVNQYGQGDLESLTFPPEMRDLSAIPTICTVYPNIKEFFLNIPANPVIVSLVMGYWPQMERLTLTLSSHGDESESGEAINWNVALIGCKAPIRVRALSTSKSGLYCDGPSIADLTCLKSLNLSLVPTRQKLWSPAMDLCDTFLFDDLLIFYGLSYLRQAQHISVQGHMFSNGALNSLRGLVHPLCHLSMDEFVTNK